VSGCHGSSKRFYSKRESCTFRAFSVQFHPMLSPGAINRTIVADSTVSLQSTRSSEPWWRVRNWEGCTEYENIIPPVDAFELVRQTQPTQLVFRSTGMFPNVNREQLQATVDVVIMYCSTTLLGCKQKAS